MSIDVREYAFKCYLDSLIKVIHYYHLFVKFWTLFIHYIVLSEVPQLNIVFWVCALRISLYTIFVTLSLIFVNHLIEMFSHIYIELF